MRNEFMILQNSDKEGIKELLDDLKVPDHLISLYTINSIKKLGKKINKNGYFALNQYIFKIQNDQIVKTFFNIKFLQDNSTLLP